VAGETGGIHDCSQGILDEVETGIRGDQDQVCPVNESEPALVPGR